MLSVLIVNWNTRDHLLRCLESLRKYPPPGDWEAVVVDNASTDGSAEAVERDHPWARLIRSGGNLGYAAGNNLAIREAKGDLLLTLNPDTEMLEGTLTKAVEIMEARPDVGVLAGRLLNPDGTTQPSVRGFPTPGTILAEILGLGRAFPASRSMGAYRRAFFDYDREGEAEQPMGTFLLFRKSALDAVGLLDEGFPIFFNEVDLLYRLRRSGWMILYSPDVRLIHYGGASTRQVRKKMIWESHRSLIRYLRKWFGQWWRWPLLVPLFGLIWLGALVRARGWDAGFRRT